MIASVDASAANITVRKAERTLHYQGDGISQSFRIGLGTSPIGRKLKQGDRKTPEGSYSITHKNPNSQFYLSLGVNYPNIDDATRGLNARLISKKEFTAIEKAIQNGVLPPQNTPLGGDIFIHGRGSQSDWTWGCIALSDEDMKFLYEQVAIGDTVTILP